LPLDIDLESVRDILDLGDGPVVAVLPGSRKSEVTRLGPLFATTAAMLAGHRDDIRFVTPVATPKLRPMIEQQLAAAGVADRFCLIDGDSVEAMSAADVVLLASGTAALESALLGKPTVAAYQVSKMTAAILRLFRLLKNEYFTMPNMLTETPLIPEFIQEDATSKALAQAVWELLEDPQRREEISRQFATMRTELALGADDRAADAVIDLATQDR
jgi:lipid-A-disaccharide synthase